MSMETKKKKKAYEEAGVLELVTSEGQKAHGTDDPKLKRFK